MTSESTQKLSLFALTGMVVGSIVGAGIFLPRTFVSPLLTTAGAYAGFRMLSDPGPPMHATEPPAAPAVNDKAA
jgi:uncharacterized membrane protein YfcA